MEKRKFEGDATGSEYSSGVLKRGNTDGSGSAGGSLVAVAMEIPSVKANVVIGKAGSVIKAIMSHSKCQIKVDQDKMQEPRKVYISGPQEGLEPAIRMIQRVVVEGPDYLQQPSGPDLGDDSTSMLCVTVDIPSAKANQVIGKGGSAVKTMNERTSCRIRVDQDAFQVTRKVFISGKIDGIVKAIDLVLRIVVEGPDFLVDSATLSSIGSGSSAVAPVQVTDNNSGKYIISFQSLSCSIYYPLKICLFIIKILNVFLCV
jgi:polyribonucleotide nucleotidyltransferase